MPSDPPTSPSASPASARGEATRASASLSGALAVVAGLGAAELTAGLIPGARSPIVSVGDVVIDSVPGWVERAVISLLGTADKPFLLITITVVAALAGALIGMLAARRFAAGASVLAGLAVVVAVAELLDPRAQALTVVAVSLAFTAAGIATLWWLLRAATPPIPAAGSRAATIGPAPVSRRRFLQQAAAVAAVAAAAGVFGTLRTSRTRIEEIRASITLPRPFRKAPPAPAGARLGISGVAPLYTPNRDFFRIDTALSVPRVDPADWSMTVEGRVDRPFRLTYAELMELPQIEADITLACVSNEVGGDLVGNARWQGVPLKSLLERAGLQAGATQVIGRSVDGFTAGFPTETALAQGDAMVAVAMNGEPLPAIHGFPARLVVPGLYGYVSATKWLSAIELTTWEETIGYWVPKGWSARGPIKTQSRIDVPVAGSSLRAGRQPIAGVAWAPTRGIEAVEVRVDDGPWMRARLAEPLDVDCWRQWVLPWDATPGEHELSVRATDGAGQVQTASLAPVAPDGATGHHTIEVSVEG